MTLETFQSGPAVRSVVHRIHLEAGISYDFIRGTVTSGYDADPDLWVIDSLTGLTSYSASAANSPSWHQSTGGSFDLRIDASSYEVDRGNYGYRLMLDRSDVVRGDIHTEAEILDGGSILGRLDNKSDADMYALEVEEGRTYQIDLDTNLIDSINDTYLSFIDGAGSYIMSTDDDGPHQLNYKADANETLFVAVEVPSGYAYNPIGDFRLSVTSDAENVTGTRKGDTLHGSDIDNYIQGYGGNDTIHAGAGNDRVIGGRGNDTLHGEGGEDTLLHAGRHSVFVNMEKGISQTKGLKDRDSFDGFENVEGTRGKDTLIGSVEDNSLFGGRGNDTIKGQGGSDVIDGGRGNDRLIGGLGSDEFVFGRKFGKDTIKDFNVYEDFIEFSHYKESKLDLSRNKGDVVIDFGGKDSVRILDASIDEVENALFFS